jgi:hypothetical protein
MCVASLKSIPAYHCFPWTTSALTIELKALLTAPKEFSCRYTLSFFLYATA